MQVPKNWPELLSCCEKVPPQLGSWLQPATKAYGLLGLLPPQWLQPAVNQYLDFSCLGAKGPLRFGGGGRSDIEAFVFVTLSLLLLLLYLAWHKHVVVLMG